ncbi:transcriptional regulator, partial [Microbispora hainanensis]|uniref:transcriptional regulator n=1 Tax=Microbispora hainanensis TaxID=568844 RepID=UPI0033F637AC
MELDPVIHAPARLQIVSLLAAAEEAEFAFVRDTLGVSDSVLSKHGSALEAAGYVAVRKGYVGKRPNDVGLGAARPSDRGHVAGGSPR